MKVDIFIIIFFTANISILYITIKWYIGEKTHETRIAIIASFISCVTVIANYYNEKNQAAELETILNKQILSLNRKNDSISKELNIYKNTGQIAIGKDNVAGNNNTVISGNDKSTITINPKEVPFIEQSFLIHEYTSTNLNLQRGDRVLIEATGSIEVGKIIGHSGPEGKESGMLGASLSEYNIVRNYAHGALMFKYKADSSWLYSGREYNFTAKYNGRLIFEVNDKDKINNSGNYQVNVKIYR